jgi:hypothetical protein
MKDAPFLVASRLHGPVRLGAVSQVNPPPLVRQRERLEALH